MTQRPAQPKSPLAPAGRAAWGLASIAMIAAGSLTATSAGAEPPSSPLPAGQSVARCVLELSPPGTVYFRGPLGRGYDINSQVRHQERFEFQVRHRGAACRYVLLLTSSNNPVQPSLQGGVGRLTYEIKADGGGHNLLTPNDEGDASRSLRGVFRPGQNADAFSLFLEVAPGQGVRAGSYDDLVVMRLFAEVDGELILQEERGFVVGLHVPAMVRAAIGSAAGGGRGATSTTIDLGQLKPGLRRDLDFSLQTNTDVTVSFTSANGGALKHALSTVRIPYVVRFNGRRVATDGSDQTALTPDQGATSRAFHVEVGDEAARGPAGEYTDVLQVTIAAL